MTIAISAPAPTYYASNEDQGHERQQYMTDHTLLESNWEIIQFFLLS